jgi:hypothetical protein
MFRVQLCPSSGAQELYRWLLPVVLGALIYRSLVWCGAVGYVSGLRDAARGIFRQTLLHVSGVSIAHHQEVHRMDTTVGTYCSF